MSDAPSNIIIHEQIIKMIPGCLDGSHLHELRYYFHWTGDAMSDSTVKKKFLSSSGIDV